MECRGQIDGKDWGSLSRAATPTYSGLRRNFTIGKLAATVQPVDTLGKLLTLLERERGADRHMSTI